MDSIQTTVMLGDPTIHSVRWVVSNLKYEDLKMAMPKLIRGWESDPSLDPNTNQPMESLGEGAEYAVGGTITMTAWWAMKIVETRPAKGIPSTEYEVEFPGENTRWWVSDKNHPNATGETRVEYSTRPEQHKWAVYRYVPNLLIGSKWVKIATTKAFGTRGPYMGPSGPEQLVRVCRWHIDSSRCGGRTDEFYKKQSGKLNNLIKDLSTIYSGCVPPMDATWYAQHDMDTVIAFRGLAIYQWSDETGWISIG